ncbi:MAG: thioredoxin domain-containing protein [Acidobacteria bacterium]|nr:thioredoxin domain-containing protein [Acidobacteriota bacterium]MCB9398716.1 thioredoxin domain-containing protein [Acidobacteriota bacterium]
MTSRPPLPTAEHLQKLPEDGGPDWNRLVFEKSPYLLQHAANPVDWYPWGDPAFEAARSQNKPVFLSIGYATCHWCHVMEHESFEDPEIAKLMNDHFICVKVDREERPDIDAIYMTACQMATGSGGWPLTVLLNHQRQPFYVGTYFPKTSRFGRIGMNDLIPRISEIWTTDRATVDHNAALLAERLATRPTAQPETPLQASDLDEAFRALHGRFDPEFGGFGQAPKFPTAHNLCFLLRYYHLTGNPDALIMVESTLFAMRKGGIFDHVGFGFHRYSTDRQWLVPHFEKMLYDQALLLLAYAETFQITQNPFYAAVCAEIGQYVLGTMTDASGGFYSAEDADSEGVEGKFYVWTPEQVITVLGEPSGRRWNQCFQIEQGGNFREEASGHKTGDNIPHLKQPIAHWAETWNASETVCRNLLETWRQQLFMARESRIHPLKDDKILTDWNGLMIAALARAGFILNQPSFVAAAEKALDFVLTHIRDNEGQLLKRFREGEARLPALLEDYSFLTYGSLALYAATFQPEYLQKAISLMDEAISRFWDSEHGGFFQTEPANDLLFRNKDFYDGAIPSGNGVAATCLIQLARLTGDPKWETYAEATLRAASGAVRHYPAGHTFLLQALYHALEEGSELVISGDEIDPLRDLLRQTFSPNLVVIHRPSAGGLITELAPYCRDQTAEKDSTLAYFCHKMTCDRPIADLDAFYQRLQQDGPKSP